MRQEAKRRLFSPPILASAPKGALPPNRTQPLRRPPLYELAAQVQPSPALSRPPAGAELASPILQGTGYRVQGTGAELASPIHLQSVRAVDANASACIIRLQHPYALGEDATLSQAQEVDLSALVMALAPDMKAMDAQPTTLDGAQPVSVMRRRQRFPTEVPTDEPELGPTHGQASAFAPSPGQTISQIMAPPAQMGTQRWSAKRGVTVNVQPMELKTWRVALK